MLDRWLAIMGSSTTAGLFGIAHFAAALAVTVHVLLNKRDVSAAISWIGLAWLSPVIGSLLYVTFGINRVTRYARRLGRPRVSRRATPPFGTTRRDDHLGALRLAASHITGRPAEAGNAIAVLVQGDEAYPRMLAAIEGARSSVVLSTYIFRDDEIGEGFIAALSDARGRGVEVRVLLDGIGSGYFLSPAYRRLRKAGVPVARFMHSPLPWRMPFLNLRTHKKLLVVDGRRAFTGGLNIGAENLLSTRPRHPVRDTHFAVAGPVVAQLAAAFAEDWLFAMGEVLSAPIWFPEPDADLPGGADARVITSGPDQDLEKLELMILAAIAVARRSIRIATPYFLPDDRLCSGLALAALRGVAVDIVVPLFGNHPIVDWAATAQMRPLLTAGCRLWYRDPPFDHSKLMTIDGAWSLIGSANWDMRSFRLNFELDLEVYDEDLAARLDALILTDTCRRITIEAIDKRSLPIALRDAGARLLLPYL